MENNEVVSEDGAVANILNDYFSTITKSLNIAENNENVATGDEISDPVTAAMEKYRSHPGVMLIKSHYENAEVFDFRRISIVEVLEQVDKLLLFYIGNINDLCQRQAAMKKKCPTD